MIINDYTDILCGGVCFGGRTRHQCVRDLTADGYLGRDEGRARSHRRTLLDRRDRTWDVVGKYVLEERQRDERDMCFSDIVFDILRCRLAGGKLGWLPHRGTHAAALQSGAHGLQLGGGDGTTRQLAFSVKFMHVRLESHAERNA